MRRVLATLVSFDFSDADGFGDAQGFVTEGASSEWKLSTGRGNQPGHSADTSFYFGDGENAFGGGTHGNNSLGTLKSPVIDLTTAPAATLSFNHFLDAEDGFDVASVEIIQAGVATEIAVSGTHLPSSTGGFVPASFDLAPFVGDTIQVAFVFRSDETVTQEGWYVDDVTIDVTTGPAESAMFDFTDSDGNPEDEGFTSSGPNDQWHVSTGRSNNFGHSAPHSFYFGRNEVAAGLGNYATNSDGTLLSPSIDLSNATSAELTFNHFLEVFPQFHSATVSVVTASGETVIAQSENELPAFTGQFQAVSLDLTPFVGQSIQLAFRLMSDFADQREGWYVDDIDVDIVEGDDTTRPTPVITGPSGPTQLTPLTLDVHFGETVVGFDAGDVTVGNGTVDSVVDEGNGAFAVTVSPTADGAVTVDIAENLISDAAGNLNFPASQFSVVVDTTDPILIAPANISVEADGLGGAADTNASIVAFLAGVTANDAITTDPVITHNAPAIFPLGVTEVTFTATDEAGNDSTVAASVTVTDTTGPILTPPPSISLEGDTIGGSTQANTAIAAFLAAATATDLVDGSVNTTNNAPASFPLGDTVVTFSADDAAGNTTTATATVTVVDTTNPTLTLPAHLTLQEEPGGGVGATNPAIVNFLAAASSTDIVDSSVTITHNAPANFPIGDTVVTFTATDDSGNDTTGDAIVTVLVRGDTIPPEVTAPANITVEGDVVGGSNDANATIAAFLAGASATDNGDTPLTVTHNGPSDFPLGNTVVTFSATDAAGNTGTAEAVVTVVDTTPPRLNSWRSDDSVVAGSSGVVRFESVFPFNWFSSNDVVDPDLTYTHDAPENLPFGITTFRTTATDDSGNSVVGISQITVTIPVAAATTYVVSTTSDVIDMDFSEGNLSLGEAILLSNGSRGLRDTITFSSLFDTPQTIHLSSQLPQISDGVTILGPGSDLLTIDAGGGETSQPGDGKRIFYVNAFNSEVRISGMSLTGGDVDPRQLNNDGGAVYARTSLQLTDTSVYGNHTLGSGGGVYQGVFGVGTITQSVIEDNSARYGGGIQSHGEIIIADSTVKDNVSTESGGGIHHARDASITSSTITGNSATGSTSGSGGGIQSGPLSRLTLSNSTISANDSAQAGSGIAASRLSELSIINSTIVDNTGRSGVDVSSDTSVLLHNSIVAGNTGGFGDFNGRLDGGSGNNLIGNSDWLTGIVDGQNGNQLGTSSSPIDPLLGPLRDNGGPTLTHALLRDSPAIDAGNNALAVDPGPDELVGTADDIALTDDQRGNSFPRIIDAAVDIGAFESDLSDTEPPVVTPPTDVSIEGDVAGGSNDSNSMIAAFLAGATATDNVDPSVTVTHDAPTDFPLGDTVVTFFATDAAGNTGMATATVTVVDTTAPRFNGSTGDKTVVAGPSGTISTASVFDVSRFRASDRVDADLTYTHDAPAQLSFGITEIAITATDDSGNSVTGITQITVAIAVAAAQTYVVSTTSDAIDMDFSPGNLSLGEAILLSNGSVGLRDTITFSSLFDTPQTINIDTQLPMVTDSVSIIGPGADLLTIDAGGGDTPQDGDGTRIFYIRRDRDVTISGLSLTGGDLDDRFFDDGGGAIYSQGNLTLTEVAIHDNHSASSFGGGGLYQSLGSATITDSAISNNSTVREGGGIRSTQGELRITNTMVDGNSSSGGGGILTSSTTWIESSTIAGNTSIDIGNGNTSGIGGGISSFGDFVLINSTVSGNLAEREASGISLSGSSLILNSTIAGNIGNSGIAVPSSRGLVLHNSIVAGNDSGGRDIDRRFAFDAPIDAASSNNLIGNALGVTGIVDGQNGNQLGTWTSPIDALLGPLQDNGGPTPTHALLTGSPAIDAGNNALAVDPGPDGLVGTADDIPLVWDQRGSLFPRILGGTVDIGAFELQSIDFGDAPESYRTTRSDGGASHIATGPRLGAARDAEIDGIFSPLAQGDDVTGIDDEDGVLFGSISPGVQSAINIDLQNAASGRVDAWIDFNQDGDWDDEGEKILDSVMTSLGLQTLNYDVPSGATGGVTFARVRVSTAGGLMPGGPSIDGEVEDYAVQVGTITSAIINAGSNSRSEITSIEVTFDSHVDAVASDFVLTNTTTGQNVTGIQVSNDGAGVSTLTFAPGNQPNPSVISGPHPGILPTLADGVYELSYRPMGLEDGAEPIAIDHFFRKYGETVATSDTVGLADFAAFRGAFGKGLGDVGFHTSLDANRDGMVSLVDFAAFRRNFGT